MGVGGSLLVKAAALAAVSASSLPGIPLCAGIHGRLVGPGCLPSCLIFQRDNPYSSRGRYTTLKIVLLNPSFFYCRLTYFGTTVVF